jgi:signal transduction histidine kinase
MDTEIILVIGASVFTFFLLMFLFNFVLKYQRKNLAHLREREQMQSNFDQILLQSQLEIQEQTLQHIGRELHDNIGQMASLIKINLNTILLSDPEKAGRKIEETKMLTMQMIADVKSLSIKLNSERITRLGLSSALEYEMERIRRTEEFNATYSSEGPLPDIDANRTIILYRIVQEALNNIVKHSGAKNVNLRLQVDKNLITLAISDDGKGFNVEETLENGSGAGLHNLKKRASLIHSILTIESNKGNGTLVKIIMPIAYEPTSSH